MMELEELKSALNWQGVYQGKDSLVIKFNESDAGLIQGLGVNDQCFYLKYPEFQDQPISFWVTRGHEHFQYWVLGERLHRRNNPAKVLTNVSTHTSHITWYENGLKHNTTGPAEIMIRGQTLSSTHPRTQENVAPDYIVEEWEEYEAYWFTHGVMSLYPMPHSMICSNGHRIFRTTNGNYVLDDYRDHASFEAQRLVANWTREGDITEEDSFRIRFITASEYYRHYNSGDPDQQGCSSISQLSWVSNGEIIDSSPEARETMRQDLFPEWNLWEGPLFPNTQEAVFTMQEALS